MRGCLVAVFNVIRELLQIRTDSKQAKKQSKQNSRFLGRAEVRLNLVSCDSKCTCLHTARRCLFVRQIVAGSDVADRTSSMCRCCIAPQVWCCVFPRWLSCSEIKVSKVRHCIRAIACTGLPRSARCATNTENASKRTYGDCKLLACTAFRTLINRA